MNGTTADESTGASKSSEPELNTYESANTAIKPVSVITSLITVPVPPAAYKPDKATLELISTKLSRRVVALVEPSTVAVTVSSPTIWVSDKAAVVFTDAVPSNAPAKDS